MERRKEAAREILLDEIRRGSASPTTDDIDESVSILYRYWRAAQEGAGRLNLRLLASVYAGQVRDKSIVADRLSVLRRPACIFTTRRNHPAGYIFAVLNKCGRDAACGHDPMTQTRAEMVPGVFEAHEDYNAALGALQRTGLISAHATGGAVGSSPRLVYQVTSRLRKLNRLAEIEGVVGRDRADAAPQATR